MNPNKLSQIKNTNQVVNDSSYRGEEKDISDPNSIRAGSNRTTNQLAILMKKRKERMANAASFASLSRFSHPNDSDSSFRNAYEEYQNGKINKTKRIESPLTKLDSSNFNAIPSRNKTSEIMNSSNAVHGNAKMNTNVKLKDQNHKDSFSAIKNLDSYANTKYSEAKNKRHHPMLDSSHNSFSMIVTTDDLDKKQKIFIPSS